MERDEIVHEALKDELKALDARASELTDRVQQWESDVATWKKEIAEAEAMALAKSVKEEAERLSKEMAEETSKGDAEGNELGAAGNDDKPGVKTSPTNEKKNKYEKKKTKKKSAAKKKAQKKAKKTAAEIERALKEEEFEERRMQCIADIKAIQADMERLSEYNDEDGSKGTTDEADGMVEKLRGTVATANLFFANKIESGGDGDTT